TFSISSLGGIGGTYFTPIINAPEVAILGVCRSTTRPVWDGTAFQPRLMLPLSLSYDHRVIDGAAAARFNAYLAQLLADFRRAMLWQRQSGPSPVATQRGGRPSSHRASETMSETIQVTVPDIGDFDQVEVIELLVKAGDAVKQEQSLITVESDKASMEIPSPAAGVVKAPQVALGDKVAQGSPILELEVEDSAATAPAAASPPAPAAAEPAGAPSAAVGADVTCQVLVLGGGPGGYSAAFRAADLGLDTVLVERYATLGGVCLNVGCIPSKALLHVAAVIDEARHMAKAGVEFGAPSVDLERLRAHKAAVVGKLTSGLAGMAKSRKVQVVRGYG